MTTQDILQKAEESLGREFTAIEQYQIKQKIAATPNGTENEAVEAVIEFILGV